MRRIISVILLSIALSGCFGTLFGGKTGGLDDIENHPPRPDPVQPHYVEWDVITSDNADSILSGDKVFIGMEYEDGIEFFKFMEDLKRYILETNQNECYYRQNLKEEICESQERFIERMGIESQEK